MKKLLALLLALVMTVCVFAACGKDEEASKDKKDDVQSEEVTEKDEKEEKTDKGSDEEGAVEEVLESYIEAAFSGDEAALDYVSEDADLYKTTEELLELFGSLEGLADSMGVPEEYQDEVNDLLKKYVEKMFSMVDYEISDIEVDGDKASAKITVKAPDFENIESIMSDLDMDAILAEKFTEDEIAALATASPEEQGEFMVKVIEIVFDVMMEKLEESSVENSSVYELEKIDGEWIIVVGE